MAANESRPKAAGADEYHVSKFKQGYRSFTNPDQNWKYCSNPDYSHDAWDSSPDGSWELRQAKTTMDTFTGINYNKFANKPGEYYSHDLVPTVNEEFDEEKYWQTAPKSKSAEDLAAELDAPRVAMEAKWTDYVAKAPEKRLIVPMWTPAMALMVSDTPVARKVNFELAGFFQLNQQGYRKNWANTRLVEYRPFKRVFSMNSNFVHDFIPLDVAKISDDDST
eukprot:UN30959